MGKTEVNNGKTLCLIQVGKVEKAKSLRDMVVPKTLANFLKRKTQLYEQGADVRRIGKYVRNWLKWVRAGVELGVNKLNADSFLCLLFFLRTVLLRMMSGENLLGWVVVMA